MIDKEYWLNLNFTQDYSIDIRKENPMKLDIECPKCGKGKLNKFGKFTICETKDTIELSKQKHMDYDIECLDEKFSGLLKCDFCKDVVAVCGTSNPEHDYDEEDPSIEYSYFRRLNPEYFSPPLKIFKLKLKYPLKVTEILLKSFSLFFIDNDSCGNKIRISVEALLDELGIARKNPVKEESYSLNQRINIYSAVNKYIGDLMHSIRWIGNYGSHENSLTQSDLLDAYIIINHILDYLYDNQENKISELSKSINENKKPASQIFPKFDNLNGKL